MKPMEIEKIFSCVGLGVRSPVNSILEQEMGSQSDNVSQTHGLFDYSLRETS